MPDPTHVPPTVPLAPTTTLAALATAWAGATRVFHRHGLDFCCRGDRTLEAACRERGLDPEQVQAELRRELRPLASSERWDDRPTAQVIAHLVDHFHAAHRRELPRLLAMAAKVEAVHRDRPECPRGLHAHLAHVAAELERHMQQEEQVLFPLLITGQHDGAAAPILAMVADHDEHARHLAGLRTLAHGFVPPAAACNTWRALYLGLDEFERDVMAHVHLENHVLFPRAAPGRPAVTA